jgi:hypothetical protein
MAQMSASGIAKRPHPQPLRPPCGGGVPHRNASANACGERHEFGVGSPLPPQRGRGQGRGIPPQRAARIVGLRASAPPQMSTSTPTARKSDETPTRSASTPESATATARPPCETLS